LNFHEFQLVYEAAAPRFTLSRFVDRRINQPGVHCSSMDSDGAFKSQALPLN